MGYSVIEALSAVMADVQAVKKADRNQHGNYSFRGIDAVVNAVGPALRKHGVVVVPHVEDVTYAEVQTSRGKPSNACRMVVSYTFWHGESSLSTRVAAEAWDHGDKAAPKAMSVAFRTALLQALALPTDEPDPDSHTYERAEVDLGPLDEAIGKAEAAGIVQDWERLRGWARQSDEHRDKAVGRVRELLAEQEPSA